MKIVVTSQGPDLDSPMDYRFGRAPYFVVVDPDTMQYEAHPNPAAMAPGGAGPQAASFIASLGANVVVTGEVGPNALPALQALGIRVVTGIGGTVREAVEAFKKGPVGTQPPKGENLEELKRKLEELEGVISRIKSKIEELEKGSRSE